MSEPQRTEPVHPGSPGDVDRAARVEQLLLAGLDQYFGGRYEQAINIWTRVAFLERGHGRARAYIERARGALAERQRESDQLLHEGVAAYQAGDTEGARALLTRAVEQGGSDETALLFLYRLGRLDAAALSARMDSGAGEATRVGPGAATTGARPSWPVTIAASLAVVTAVSFAALAVASWLRELPVEVQSGVSVPPDSLPRVRGSEQRLVRARALAAEGRVRDALEEIEPIGVGDGSRAEADRLRADLQRALLAGVGSGRAPGDGRIR